MNFREAVLEEFREYIVHSYSDSGQKRSPVTIWIGLDCLLQEKIQKVYLEN